MNVILEGEGGGGHRGWMLTSKMKQRNSNISHMLNDVILSREGSWKVPQEAASVENGVHLQCPPLLSRAEPITALDPGQNGPLILTIQISVLRENLRRFAGEMDENAEAVFNAARLFTFLAWMKRQKEEWGLVTGRGDLIPAFTNVVLSPSSSENGS